jgi:hypothetical protein
MFTVARDYLPIPGAEVDVKRLFSITRDILGLYQSLIGAETLTALILVKDFAIKSLARSKITCTIAENYK